MACTVAGDGLTCILNPTIGPFGRATPRTLCLPLASAAASARIGPRDVCTPEEVGVIGRAREQLALYRKNEDLISIGAYQKGANANLDRAIALHEPLRDFLRQPVHEHTPRAKSFLNLKQIVA